VRGRLDRARTTLRRSILRILKRLNPKKIIIASTARRSVIRLLRHRHVGDRQVCGVRAAIALLKERGQTAVIAEVYNLCRRSCGTRPRAGQPRAADLRAVCRRGDFGADHPAGVTKPNGWKGEIEIIFQSIEHLHGAAEPFG